MEVVVVKGLIMMISGVIIGDRQICVVSLLLLI